MLHWKVEPGSFEENATRARWSEWLTVTESIVVTGGVESSL